MVSNINQIYHGNNYLSGFILVSSKIINYVISKFIHAYFSQKLCIWPSTVITVQHVWSWSSTNRIYRVVDYYYYSQCQLSDSIVKIVIFKNYKNCNFYHSIWFIFPYNSFFNSNKQFVITSNESWFE